MFRKTAAIRAEQQKTMQTVFGQFSRDVYKRQVYLMALSTILASASAVHLKSNTAKASVSCICKDNPFSEALAGYCSTTLSSLSLIHILQRMQDFGVNLICVEDGIDSSKDSGKLMISVLSAVAEIERENILVQTMEGRKPVSYTHLDVYKRQ